MSKHRPLAFWLDSLTIDVFPVLAQSRNVLLAMEKDVDLVRDETITAQIYHDPFLIANLLRYVAGMPRRGLAGEVTTVERMVMMIGMRPFFSWLKQLPVLENELQAKPQQLYRLYQVLSTTYHAAYQAMQWSCLRKDINADEIFVASMMQNLPVWAGWLLLPEEMAAVEQIMGQEKTDYFTAFARHADYHFDQVQYELASAWNLPQIYRDFTRDHNAIRYEGVTLALQLAGITRFGWWQPQVSRVVEKVAEWLHLPVDETNRKIHVYSVQAAHQSRGWYGQATPAAAWLPMLPGEWPGDVSPAIASSHDADQSRPVETKAVTSGDVTENLPGGEVANTSQQLPQANGGKHVLQPEVVSRIVANIKAHMDGSYDIGQLLSLVLKAMHDGLAFDRVVFALVSPDMNVKARFTLGVDAGAPMKRLNFSLKEKHLFTALMSKTQAVWYRKESQQKLSPLLLPKLRAQIGRGEFMAMSVHVHNKPVGFFYADYDDNGHMDETVYAGFKQLCQLTAEGMAHLSKKA